jgi:hypothetical protein
MKGEGEERVGGVLGGRVGAGGVCDQDGIASRSVSAVMLGKIDLHENMRADAAPK